jgi:hypothetical protein
METPLQNLKYYFRNSQTITIDELEKAIEELYDNERSFFIQGFELGESYADSKFQSEAVRAYNRLYKTNNI